MEKGGNGWSDALSGGIGKRYVVRIEARFGTRTALLVADECTGSDGTALDGTRRRELCRRLR